MNHREVLEAKIVSLYEALAATVENAAQFPARINASVYVALTADEMDLVAENDGADCVVIVDGLEAHDRIVVLVANGVRLVFDGPRRPASKDDRQAMAFVTMIPGGGHHDVI